MRKKMVDYLLEQIYVFLSIGRALRSC